MTSLASSPVTIRFVPTNGKAKSITFSGRTYAVAANSFVDVPYMDAPTMRANGFVQVAGSGTTAQRPASPFTGQAYHDTTLALTILFEGTAWRNPATGAAV